MKPRSIRAAVVGVTILLLLFPSTPLARGKKGKGSGKKSQPPQVTLIVSDPVPSRFPVEVLASDRDGVARVSVSLDGEIAAVRLEPPWVFSVLATDLPMEVCAVAQDSAGNFGADCRTVHAPEPPGCLDNRQCGSGELCRTPTGECGAVGLCEFRPSVCDPQPVDPVCGCDARTHRSECDALAAAVNVAFPGPCPPCTDNSDCSRLDFCSKPVGECDGEGTCEPGRGVCHGAGSPGLLCGCDGKTYTDTCPAGQALTSLSSLGACP